MIQVILDDIYEFAKSHELTIEYVELGTQQMEELKEGLAFEAAEEPLYDVVITKYAGISIRTSANFKNLIRPKYEQI